MTKKIKKPVKPKRVTKAKLRSLARSKKRRDLKDWSVAVRERDGSRCIVCGKTEHIQAHHVIPKERFPQHSLDLDNGVSLCPGHHKYGSFSFHRHQLWSMWWLEKSRPEQFQKIQGLMLWDLMVLALDDQKILQGAGLSSGL